VALAHHDREQLRDGKGDAYAYCKGCDPGAIQVRWTRQLVLAAMGHWLELYGRLPSSYDRSRTHARRREALDRLTREQWPAASVVTVLFGRWADARAVASDPRSKAGTGAPDPIT
jgi:hypothetical protein